MKNIVLTAIILATSFLAAQEMPSEDKGLLRQVFIYDMELLTLNPNLICEFSEEENCLRKQQNIVNSIIEMFENDQYDELLSILRKAEIVWVTQLGNTKEQFWKNPFLLLFGLILLTPDE